MTNKIIKIVNNEIVFPLGDDFVFFPITRNFPRKPVPFITIGNFKKIFDYFYEINTDEDYGWSTIMGGFFSGQITPQKFLNSDFEYEEGDPYKIDPDSYEALKPILHPDCFWEDEEGAWVNIESFIILSLFHTFGYQTSSPRIDGQTVKVVYYFTRQDTHIMLLYYYSSYEGYDYSDVIEVFPQNISVTTFITAGQKIDADQILIL